MIGPARWPGVAPELAPGAVHVWSAGPDAAAAVVAAYAPRPGLRSSLSRSRGIALVAVADGRAVGIDVEAIRPGRRARAIADSRFTPAEAAALRALDGPELDAAFHRLWVRKEAYLKATGEGLAGGLASFDALAAELPAGWELSDVDVGAGYAAALVTAPADAGRRSP